MEGEEGPHPKWWLLHFTNYLVVVVFVGSIVWHVRRTDQRETKSLLPVLLTWSICMAYFFGFFGISFVDKDDDLIVALSEMSDDEEEETEWACSNHSNSNEKRPQNFSASKKKLFPISEETSPPVPMVLLRREQPQQRDDTLELAIASMRSERDRRRASAINYAGSVVLLRVDGCDVACPCDDDVLQRGARALRLAGGTRTLALTQREPSFYASACVSLVDGKTALEAKKLAETQKLVLEKVKVLGRTAFLSTVAHSSKDSARKSAKAVADAIVASLGTKRAKVNCVLCSRTASSSATEATIPGPILKRLLGVSVADVCQAKAKIDAASLAFLRHNDEALKPFATFLQHSTTSVLEHFSRTLGAHFSEGVKPLEHTFSLEPLNNGRDIHLSLSTENSIFLQEQNSLVNLVHDPPLFSVDTVALSLTLAAALANLAASCSS